MDFQIKGEDTQEQRTQKAIDGLGSLARYLTTGGATLDSMALATSQTPGNAETPGFTRNRLEIVFHMPLTEDEG